MNNDIRGVLERPFAELKTRPGRNGQQLTYIEGHQVIERLNAAFESEWSFRILEHEITNDEIIVVGELEAGGLTKQAFGGTELTRSRNGGAPVCVSDDLKSAATDALKKAATLLGVGLHLYGAKGSNTGGAQVIDHPAKRLSRKQYAYLTRLASERGLDRAGLDRVAKEKFGKTAAYISSREASRFIDELRQGGRNGLRHPG